MNEFNNKSEGELKKLLVDKRKALHDFRFAFAGGKVKDVKGGKKARKDIARVLTAISMHNKTGATAKTENAATNATK